MPLVNISVNEAKYILVVWSLFTKETAFAEETFYKPMKIIAGLRPKLPLLMPKNVTRVLPKCWHKK